MSEKEVKEAIANEQLVCPKCKKAIQKYDKYSDTIDSVRDGFNVQDIDSRASRVTLICGNEGCDWKERTEYWNNFEKE